MDAFETWYYIWLEQRQGAAKPFPINAARAAWAEAMRHNGPNCEERLKALLEALEVQAVEKLIKMPPEYLRAVGIEIAKAAKLGAHLYQSSPTATRGSK